jgi:hypothetical protein
LGDDLVAQNDGGGSGAVTMDDRRHPWLHEHNLLEVEEVVLGHMGQKEFWAGCRNYFQILKQGFQFEKIKRFKYFHTEFELDSR